MDALKARVPFWKKEISASDTRWVQQKDSDRQLNPEDANLGRYLEKNATPDAAHRALARRAGLMLAKSAFPGPAEPIHVVGGQDSLDPPLPRSQRLRQRWHQRHRHQTMQGLDTAGHLDQ